MHEASKERLMQCVCAEGYGGIRCERLTGGTGETSSQNISCAGEPFEFACRNGTIRVEYASYGAAEGYACSPQLVSVRQTCSNPNSLKTITNKCEGLNYCTIQELKEVFPETPCPVQNELFLHYRFTCSEGKVCSELKYLRAEDSSKCCSYGKCRGFRICLIFLREKRTDLCK
ncbi:hypothetical protein OESDEN_20291 [Oesophagostomum dentatum]|uniref:SUEL-type lectin domain-containing protein n=1 Tax=Oesophagostomum dentatum TaxID=61180 RepID=A0A0B1SA01_OESDE|nr:hypothetical protein OESDEN_20291 [Oesophagostomum dentatum]